MKFPEYPDFEKDLEKINNKQNFDGKIKMTLRGDFNLNMKNFNYIGCPNPTELCKEYSEAIRTRLEEHPDKKEFIDDLVTEDRSYDFLIDAIFYNSLVTRSYCEIKGEKFDNIYEDILPPLEFPISFPDKKEENSKKVKEYSCLPRDKYGNVIEKDMYGSVIEKDENGDRVYRDLKGVVLTKTSVLWEGVDVSKTGNADELTFGYYPNPITNLMPTDEQLDELHDLFYELKPHHKAYREKFRTRRPLTAKYGKVTDPEKEIAVIKEKEIIEASIIEIEETSQEARIDEIPHPQAENIDESIKEVKVEPVRKVRQSNPVRKVRPTRAETDNTTTRRVRPENPEKTTTQTNVEECQESSPATDLSNIVNKSIYKEDRYKLSFLKTRFNQIGETLKRGILHKVTTGFT